MPDHANHRGLGKVQKEASGSRSAEQQAVRLSVRVLENGKRRAVGRTKKRTSSRNDAECGLQRGLGMLVSPFAEKGLDVALVMNCRISALFLLVVIQV